MCSKIVKTFNGNDFNIVKEGEDIWWWGSEVAKVLGYARPDEAVSCHVDEEDKRKFKKLVTDKNGSAQNRHCWQINECGLYCLAFNSKLQMAKSFKRWVLKDVIPSIRKTGRYQVHNKGFYLRSEKDLHYEVVKEIRKRWPHFVLVVQMGELQDTKGKRMEAWKKGFTGGQPDIMITNNHESFYGLALELKTPGGTGVLSGKQAKVLERYRGLGWRVEVMNDFADILFLLEEYNKGVRVLCVKCKNLFKNSANLLKHNEKYHTLINGRIDEEKSG